MQLNTTALGELVCPYCGYKSDSVTGVTTGAPPKPGDVSLCIMCEEICIFDGQLQFSKPTAELYEAIANTTLIKRAREALREAKLRFKSSRAN